MSGIMDTREVKILLSEAQRHRALADLSRDAIIARDHRMVADVLEAVVRAIPEMDRRAVETLLLGKGGEPVGMAERAAEDDG